MLSQILILEKNVDLRGLLDRRSTWLIFYLLMALIFESFLYSSESNVLFYPGSGIVLAALLIMPKRFLYDFWLLFGLYAIDFFIKIVIQQYQVVMATGLTFAFLLQSWIGAYLLYKYSPNSIIPKTYKGVIGFISFGCLLPTFFVNNISAFLYWLQGSSYVEQWLLWSSHRALSIVLIAPFLLFISDLIKSDKRPINIRYNWLAWFLVCIVTMAIFIFVNPNNNELTIYSFLLMPIFSFCAVRYSLAFNSFVSLSVGLIILWCYNWVVNHNLTDSWGEHFTLSLFVFVNQCMLLLVSTVISEREQALIRAKKMSQMYEMISNVNQMLVGMKLSETEILKKLCSIITKKSEVSQACISLVGDIRHIKLSECTNCNVKNIKYDNCSRSLCIVSNKTACYVVDNVDNISQKMNKCICLTLEHDFKSAESYHIYKDGKHFAVLSLFFSEYHLFDDEMNQLFKGMANDISFALDVLAGRMRLQVISEAFEHSKEAIIITNKDSEIINVNPSFTAVTGYSVEDVMGKNPRLLKSGKESKNFYVEMWRSIINKGYWTGEFRNRKKGGELYTQRGTISSVKDDNGKVKHIIGIMEDVTEQKKYEQQILRLANFDILTGLPNRKMLQNQFKLKVDNTQKNNKLAVLFIDLDEFKHINDAYGHQFGDLLLVAVTERMRSCVSNKSILSRFGGDEFIILYEGDLNSIDNFANKLIGIVSKPYYISEQKVSISCSIGIGVAPVDSSSLDELIGFADAAMYKAKSIGRSTYSFYSPYMKTRAIEKVELKHELEDAVKDNQFVLFYQPKVNVNTGEIIGFEALVRWQHPTRGLLAPGHFISMAEESGQIVAIDYWVLEAVIIQISKWRKSNFVLFPIALNLSLSIFTDLKFIDFLKSLLAKHQVPANLIDLELTERVAMVDFDYTKRTLNSLKNLGVNISIDDFGTGYSSLAYLRDFPIDTLKIDRAFIVDVHLDKKNQGIVSAMLAIAGTMGMNVIAEGVESNEELSYLKKCQCDYYQGYLYSKPVSVSQMQARFLEKVG
ncbi:EAL domain-containing protein [Shewanella sp. SM20]|uniref:EAL domain-containing protein n=1 Tax=Shewanella sp. SM20 TaxID=2912792 RepID=UPI0021D827AB|nr:EAL domain-containing protein [Shewanella sp. SM20]MCU8094116.1 EAL domain-containing protein [Shewanella sp. SM20]